MALRVVAISDTHGMHDGIEIPEGDVLVHAGDMTTHGELEDIVAFNNFLGRQPHRYKVVIAGNHDWGFQRTPRQARALITHGIYLRDEAIVIEGVKFYGSPWQPWFLSWAFNIIEASELRRVWDLIDGDTDVLITHGPPQGQGDRTSRGNLAGCEQLAEVVGLVRPAFHVFGHIHEGYGVSRDAHTTYVNASTCTLGYEPTNAALVFDVVARHRAL